MLEASYNINQRTEAASPNLKKAACIGACPKKLAL